MYGSHPTPSDIMKSNLTPQPSKPIDYHAIAIRLVGRSPLAASLVAVQLRGRKAGLRKTTLKTLQHKALSRLKFSLSQQKAEAIFHLYSELGIGSVAKEYRQPVVHWNPRLDMHCLGRACDELTHQAKSAQQIAAIGKGPTVVCLLPEGSLAVLKQVGLAQTLEIELCGLYQSKPSVASETATQPSPA